jgi:hypothetical protein
MEESADGEMSEPEHPKTYNWELPAESPPADPPALAPFDPRTDTSADAYHIAGAIAKSSRENAKEASVRIVKHMWIIFVLLPVVFYVVYELATH